MQTKNCYRVWWDMMRYSYRLPVWLSSKVIWQCPHYCVWWTRLFTVGLWNNCSLGSLLCLQYKSSVQRLFSRGTVIPLAFPAFLLYNAPCTLIPHPLFRWQYHFRAASENIQFYSLQIKFHLTQKKSHFSIIVASSHQPLCSSSIYRSSKVDFLKNINMTFVHW